MLISHKHKFIYIHIFKTAGTSISVQLAPYSRFIDLLVYGYWPTVKFFNTLNILTGRKSTERITGFHKHATAYDAQKRLSRTVYNSYFKFAFVRNPWDWCASLYFYWGQNWKKPQSRKVSEMKFADFIKWWIDSRPPLQFQSISDLNNDVIVDYVGKFETLEADFNHVCEKLNLRVSGLPRKNISVNRRTKDYRQYYDAGTRDLVGQYFRKDIARFNYSFE